MSTPENIADPEFATLSEASNSLETTEEQHSESNGLSLLPESTIGGVQVVRLIGCGSVAESWFAVDPVHHREVVVKVLRHPWAGDSSTVAYFHRQLQLISELRHPNLANVLSVGEENGLLYWITEWLKGGSLGPKVRRKGPMEINSALQVLEQAIAGLEHGTSAHLVHGSLKPENILLERSGAVKVTDLGIEFAARQLVTGTPAIENLWVAEYTAPEIRSGAMPDVRSDIYSLGAVLLYAVAGIAPHDGMLDATSPRITSGLRQLLLQMTAEKPADRPDSYSALRAMVEKLQSGQLEESAPVAPDKWFNDTRADSKEATAPMDELPPSASQHISIDIAETIIEPMPAWVAEESTPENVAVEAIEIVPDDLPEAPAPIAAPLPTSQPRALEDVFVTPKRQSSAGSRPAVKRARRSPLVPALAFVVIAGLAGGGWWYYHKIHQATSSAATTQATQDHANPATASRQVSAAPAVSAGKSDIPPAVTADEDNTPMKPLPQAPTTPAVKSVSKPAARPAAEQKLPPVAQLPGVDPSVELAAQPKVSTTLPGVQTPQPSAPAGPVAGEIIIDDAGAGALILDPPSAWRYSSETRSSYAGSSLVAGAGGTPKKATFVADVPADGRYKVYLYWTSRSSDIRSALVPVTVNTAVGPIKINADQVNTPTDFNLIGTYQLKAGRQPLVTISTEGVANLSGTVHVSVDALKLVPAQP